MFSLPSEIIDVIYEFDGRVREYRKCVIMELNNKAAWNNYLNDAIIESYVHVPKELYPNVYPTRDFHIFYFSKFFSHRKSIFL
tara:strand:+ start:36 stop:284 length:249 start_codon:yes stop_codon:yes gene_type:complete